MHRLAALLLTVATACAAEGAMHQATLMGQCAENDTACSRRHPLAPLAVGARFQPEVSTQIAGTSTPNLRLESAAPDVLALDCASAPPSGGAARPGEAGTCVAGALVAVKPGASAVLISTEDGSVVDFVHVWVAPVTGITLARRDGERVSGTVGLAVGEDLQLVPTMWNGAQQLSGEVTAQWTITGDAQLSVLPDGANDRRRLRARTPGKATLTVAMGDTTTTLNIEVVQ